MRNGDRGMANDLKEYVWQDRKRTLFFGLPISFTKYSVSNEVLYINRGFFNSVEDEVRLYRIMDISLKRSLIQKMFGLGTIHCCSGDKTMKDFDIVNIKKSREVKALLSDLIETQRESKRVISRESFNEHPDMEHDGFDDTQGLSADDYEVQDSSMEHND